MMDGIRGVYKIRPQSREGVCPVRTFCGQGGGDCSDAEAIGKLRFFQNITSPLLSRDRRIRWNKTKKYRSAARLNGMCKMKHTAHFSCSILVRKTEDSFKVYRRRRFLAIGGLDGTNKHR